MMSGVMCQVTLTRLLKPRIGLPFQAVADVDHVVAAMTIRHIQTATVGPILGAGLNSLYWYQRVPAVTVRTSGMIS